jgi:hypothetical protein
MCEKVTANLVAAVNLPVPAIECRILLPSSPLSVLPVGDHTLLVSRTLLDVLPDEASIAMMLAHGIGHLAANDSEDVKGLLQDTLDSEVLRQLQSNYQPHEGEADIDAKVVEMLGHSIYKDELLVGGLFLDMMAGSAASLPALIGPRFGQHADSTQALRMSALMRKRLGNCSSPDVACALPIGARLWVDPLTGQLALLGASTTAEARDKKSLAVTAFFPRLTYYVAPDAVVRR